MPIWPCWWPVSYTHLDVYKRHSAGSRYKIGGRMTGIVMLSRADSLQCVARSLGLPGPANLDNALIAQSLRRTVFIAAPCSARVACALVVDALRPLVDDPEELRMRVDDVIYILIAVSYTHLYVYKRQLRRRRNAFPSRTGRPLQNACLR